MSAATVRFNVGGTVSEVAVSTIQSKPEGLLAKMTDGRFQSGKDPSGAYFVDRDPLLFRIVLDVHRDNKVYPLPSGLTRERVLAELQYYGLQDFEDVPMEISVQSKIYSLHETSQHLQELTVDFSKWQKEQERIGQTLLTEGFARLFVARAEVAKEKSPSTLRFVPVDVVNLPQTSYEGKVVFCEVGSDIAGQVVRLFEQENMKATVGLETNSVTVQEITYHPGIINLEPAVPKSGA